MAWASHRPRDRMCPVATDRPRHGRPTVWEVDLKAVLAWTSRHNVALEPEGTRWPREWYWKRAWPVESAGRSPEEVTWSLVHLYLELCLVSEVPSHILAAARTIVHITKNGDGAINETRWSHGSINETGDWYPLGSWAFEWHCIRLTRWSSPLTRELRCQAPGGVRPGGHQWLA